MIAKLYAALKGAGLKVYSPGRHPSAEDAPYVVVSEQEQTGYGTNTIGFQLVAVIAYVPLTDYFKLEEECEKVRQALRGAFEPTGYESRPIVEDLSLIHI